MLWRTFRCYGVLLDVMAYFWMLWHTFGCYGVLFDVMAYLLMSRLLVVCLSSTINETPRTSVISGWTNTLLIFPITSRHLFIIETYN